MTDSVGKRRADKQLKGAALSRKRLKDAVAAIMEMKKEKALKHGSLTSLAKQFGVPYLHLWRAIKRTEKGANIFRKGGRPTVITEDGIENWEKLLNTNNDAGKSSTRASAMCSLSSFTRNRKSPCTRTSRRILKRIKAKGDIKIQRSRSVECAHIQGINRVVLHSNFKV